MTSNKPLEFIRTAIAVLAIFTLFILPVKFGLMVAMPETSGFYPGGLFNWMIITWPVTVFPVVSGCLLVLALIFYPPAWNTAREAFITAILWGIVACTAMIGLLNASVLDFGLMEIVHLAGVAAFAATVWLILANCPEMKMWFLYAILVGTLVTLYISLEQYFVGFAETREFVAEQVKRTGMEMHEDMQMIMSQNRIYGPFGICNSLAAHLLLTVPLGAVLLWNLAGRVEPPKVSQCIFVPPFVLVSAFVLYGTWSRAAILAVIAGVVLFTLLLPIARKFKLAIIICGVLTVIGGALAIKYSYRGFSSIMVRFDYILRSAEMFAKHPFAGTGWGDFFHDYMQTKTILSKEAPHTPHNIIMAFASQTGIVGLIAICAAMCYPVWRGARKFKKPILKLIQQPETMIILGFLAWACHALADINLQIPGTLATAAAMLVILTLPGNKPDKKAKINVPWRAVWSIAALVFAAFTIYGGVFLTRVDMRFAELSDLCDVRRKTQEEYMKVSQSEVIDKLKKCNELAPYSPYPWKAAGDFMLSRGYIDMAEDLINQALKRSPQSPSLYFRLYQINMLRGQRSKGLEYLRKAIELFPNNVIYQKAAEQEKIN